MSHSPGRPIYWPCVRCRLCAETVAAVAAERRDGKRWPRQPSPS